MKYDVGEFTTNAGNIKDDNGDLISQDTFTSIVKEDNYPTFRITKVSSLFHLEEPITIGDTLTDLKVSVVNKAFIKVTGRHEIKKGDVLKAAGYNKPALNAPRGNVLEGNYPIRWTGPLYLK